MSLSKITSQATVEILVHSEAIADCADPAELAALINDMIDAQNFTLQIDHSSATCQAASS